MPSPKLKELAEFLEIDLDDLKGDKGDRGDKGEKGDKGERGENGKDGKDGKDGKAGKDGKQGDRGEKGENGKDGKDGRDGQDGQDGKDGVKGREGKGGGGGGYSFIQRKWDMKVYVQTTATKNGFSKMGWDVVLCDCTANNITISLPSATHSLARITVKKTDASANTVTLDALGSQTIDGDFTLVITTQYTSVTVVSDGVNWYII